MDFCEIGNLEILGMEEEKIIKSFVHIVNSFSTVFKSDNMDQSFSTEISTFDGILDDPRSFGMSFTWQL